MIARTEILIAKSRELQRKAMLLHAQTLDAIRQSRELSLQSQALARRYGFQFKPHAQPRLRRAKSASASAVSSKTFFIG